MAKIAVFDSGLGSLSIIKAMQSSFKSDIIYFADQSNYPYGKKSQAQLHKIVEESIKQLHTKFSPDMIVVASNTPSLLLDLESRKIVDVKPPLNHARKISISKKIAILATSSAIKSKGLTLHIKKYKFPKSIKIYKIDASELVDLVETGKFLTNEKFCIRVIRKSLDQYFCHSPIDTVTLSSTHLPFLKKLLEKEYPSIQFIDPGEIVAKKIFSKVKNKQSKRNSLKIFTSGDTREFQNQLKKIGIKNKVTFLTI